MKKNAAGETTPYAVRKLRALVKSERARLHEEAQAIRVERASLEARGMFWDSYDDPRTMWGVDARYVRRLLAEIRGARVVLGASWTARGLANVRASR